MSRDFERDIIPMARHFGMALAPWGALGGGRFQSAKQLKERKEKLRGGTDLSEDEVRMSEALSKVAAEHGIESVTAVALAYVMHKAPYVYSSPTLAWHSFLEPHVASFIREMLVD